MTLDGSLPEKELLVPTISTGASCNRPVLTKALILIEKANISTGLCYERVCFSTGGQHQLVLISEMILIPVPLEKY